MFEVDLEVSREISRFVDERTSAIYYLLLSIYQHLLRDNRDCVS